MAKAGLIPKELAYIAKIESEPVARADRVFARVEIRRNGVVGIGPARRRPH
jgi:hypothetical protein